MAKRVPGRASYDKSVKERRDRALVSLGLKKRKLSAKEGRELRKATLKQYGLV